MSYVVVIGPCGYRQLMREDTAQARGLVCVAGPFEEIRRAEDAMSELREREREAEIEARRYMIGKDRRIRRYDGDGTDGLTLEDARAELARTKPIRKTRAQEKIEAAEKAGVKIPASWRT